MYYLIAFYQRIVELWFHAKNFPNDTRIYENIKNVIQEWGYTYKINNISAPHKY